MNQNEPMDKAAKEPEEVRKAKEKAMRLLLQQDRTEKELRDRLYRAGSVSYTHLDVYKRQPLQSVARRN